MELCPIIQEFQAIESPLTDRFLEIIELMGGDGSQIRKAAGFWKKERALSFGGLVSSFSLQKKLEPLRFSPLGINTFPSPNSSSQEEFVKVIPVIQKMANHPQKGGLPHPFHPEDPIFLSEFPSKEEQKEGRFVVWAVNPGSCALMEDHVRDKGKIPRAFDSAFVPSGPRLILVDPGCQALPLFSLDY